MKTVLVVTDGVGVRNFLYTGVLEELLERGPVTLWHAFPERVAETLAEPAAGLVADALPPYREGAAERVLRQAKVYAQVYAHRRRDAGDFLLRAWRPRGRWRTRAATHLARLLGRAHGSAAGAALLDRWHARVVRRSPAVPAFRDWLRRERPDVVFCTHQRASRAVPALAAARELGIPTATFVFSWDNLPKGRMAVHADCFLVWSERMRRELLGYYPEVEPERVHVVGTPQFEPYFDPDLRQSREAFLRSAGLDPIRPVVCFSGDDQATSPADPAYLADLAAALRDWPQEDRPQVLFRPCPADGAGRYRRVLDEHPEIAVLEPAWQQLDGDWTQRLPAREDLARLVNTVAASDVVVNLGSTMAMDFAVLDKPAVYVAYDPPGLDGWVEGIYRLPHFESVHRLQPVHWARSAAELGDEVRRALERRGEKRSARRAWLDEVLHHPLERASHRVVGALETITRRAVARAA